MAACVTCGHRDEHTGGGLGICLRDRCGCDGPVRPGTGFVRIRRGTDTVIVPAVSACACHGSKPAGRHGYRAGLLIGWAVGTGCMLVPLTILAVGR